MIKIYLDGHEVKVGEQSRAGGGCYLSEMRGGGGHTGSHHVSVPQGRESER